MARDFTLDQQAAKESNAGSKRIKESGKYIGKFKAAWYEQNDKGTESVHFLFESDEGQEAGPLALYTHNGKGEQLPSYKTFNAVLTCMKLRGVKAQKGQVELYDFDTKAMVKKTKELYPELAGKPIGLVLQQEEYEKSNGDIGERMIIVAPFEAATGKVAVEILNSQDAKALDGLVRWLEASPVKKMHGSKAPRHAGDSYADSRATTGNQFEDDDIPF
jgi:hypothetical protein